MKKCQIKFAKSLKWRSEHKVNTWENEATVLLRFYRPTFENSGKNKYHQYKDCHEFPVSYLTAKMKLQQTKYKVQEIHIIRVHSWSWLPIVFLWAISWVIFVILFCCFNGLEWEPLHSDRLSFSVLTQGHKEASKGREEAWRARIFTHLSCWIKGLSWS